MMMQSQYRGKLCQNTLTTLKLFRCIKTLKDFYFYLMLLWNVIGIHTPPHSQVIITNSKRGSHPHLHRLDKAHWHHNVTAQCASRLPPQ